MRLQVDFQAVMKICLLHSKTFKNIVIFIINVNIMEVIYKNHIVKDDGTVINKYGKNVGYIGCPKGYRYITLDGKRVLKHRFIWEAFFGEIPQGMEIDHIIPIADGGGDELSNLRIVTSSQNKRNPKTIEKYKISNKGKSEHLRKKINKMDKLTHEIISTYISITEASVDVGVSRKCISDCLHGRQKTSGGYMWEIS